MRQELARAIGIPALVLAALAIEQGRDQLPLWLQRLSGRPF